MTYLKDIEEKLKIHIDKYCEYYGDTDREQYDERVYRTGVQASKAFLRKYLEDLIGKRSIAYTHLLYIARNSQDEEIRDLANETIAILKDEESL